MASRICRQTVGIVEQLLAPALDGLDMRLLAHGVVGQLPHPDEGRIEQLRLAVAAEHGDAFGEAVQRFALDPDHAVEAAGKLEALGDVVEQIGDAAFGIRRGDDRQRAAVGQIPGVLGGLDRAIGLVQLGLPGAEVRLLRQFSRGAELVEHAGIVGIGVEEGAVEVPQPPIGIVVEGEPALAVEHGNAGGELVERAAMRLRHPHQSRAQRIRLAGVDRDADTGAADIDGAHVVHAPLAAGHDRQPRGEVSCLLQAALHGGAVGAVEQLELALLGVNDVGRFGRAHIGRIGEGQRAVLALGPDRPWRGSGEAAQHLGFVGQRLVAQIGLGQIAAQAGKFANPDNGLAADGAADRFQRVAVGGGQRDLEAVTAFAQRIDGVIHLQRRFRRQPGSEGEHALRRRIAGQHHGDVA